MKLTDLYNKIISQEPYNDMSVFFSSYESFEEIPLISRYSRLKLLKNRMSDDSVSDFLVGLSFFLLNSIKALSLKAADDSIFFAVTFTGFEILEEQGVIIPNIFIYPKPASINFLEKIQKNSSNENSQEVKEVKRHFLRCNLDNIFDFYESRFYDSACGEDIVRVFVIPKSFKK
ncbi:Imm15 family immunity protein [Pseudomonas sp. HY7a-MNA-CIBAN-0227]|uniref:Imm15 family immunity protein n=1 Tax=Pseudomonas sp. HY7a-MNA-CIBAN-0227 TaxID=3140474 RepID=UPI003329F1D1